jgi:hypothetical protein
VRVAILLILAAATVYYDCYRGGNTVPVFNGTIDVSLPQDDK